jgi:hypothetical protein
MRYLDSVIAVPLKLVPLFFLFIKLLHLSLHSGAYRTSEYSSKLTLMLRFGLKLKVIENPLIHLPQPSMHYSLVNLDLVKPDLVGL